MIARAAEGSARDGLSLLDQAIAHGAGRVEADAVRGMLGLADRARVVDLFGHVIKGDVAEALSEFNSQYEAGASPSVVLTDLADFTHLVTRLKYVPNGANDPSLSEVERVRGADYAESVAVTTLSRIWQMLLKGIPEVENAARQAGAAEMVLIRLAHAAHLPSPEEAARRLLDMAQDGGGAPQGAGSRGGHSGGGNGGGARGQLWRSGDSAGASHRSGTRAMSQPQPTAHLQVVPKADASPENGGTA